jgi:hypothetical protein
MTHSLWLPLLSLRAASTLVLSACITIVLKGGFSLICPRNNCRRLPRRTWSDRSQPHDSFLMSASRWCHDSVSTIVHIRPSLKVTVAGTHCWSNRKRWLADFFVHLYHHNGHIWSNGETNTESTIISTSVRTTAINMRESNSCACYVMIYCHS